MPFKPFVVFGETKTLGFASALVERLAAASAVAA
jgi:hypothetical protein